MSPTPLMDLLYFFINACIHVSHINVFHILSLLPRWFYCVVGNFVFFPQIIYSRLLISCTLIIILYRLAVQQQSCDTGTESVSQSTLLNPVIDGHISIALTTTTAKALSVLRQQCSSIIGASTRWTVHI